MRYKKIMLKYLILPKYVILSLTINENMGWDGEFHEFTRGETVQLFYGSVCITVLE